MEEPLTTHPVEVDPKQLTRGEWVRLWWGCVWRYFLISVAGLVLALAVAVVLGAISGVIISAFGREVQEFRLLLRLMGGVVGFVFALVFLTIWLRWMLNARIGNLRLALLKIDATPEPTTAMADGGGEL